jgi:hypothetical protein
MELTALLMAAEMAINMANKAPSRPQAAPTAQTQGVSLGMAKADVIRAIGEPYTSGYSMYSGDYMSYRGSMCKEGTCQVWLRHGSHVTSLNGVK